jgi:choline dehydrogenase-like flavoprotein
MLIDARTLPKNQTLDTEVCIVGAGAAGITLAMEFANQPFRTVLVESGGLDVDGDTQALYRGESVGLPYFALDSSRLRYFGGTTNHWSGVCRPLDDEDFQRRDWIPHSGWPITKAAIAPYYTRALPLFRLEHDEWGNEFWVEPDRPLLPLDSTRVLTRVIRRASYPGNRLHFGEAYRDQVVQAENVTTYLHGNAVRIDTNDSGKAVTRVHFATLAGNRFSVSARVFVLAAGGIENARILLLSNHQRSAGLGNHHDLVGRFFLEHPILLAARFQPASPRLPVRFYEYRRFKGAMLNAGLVLPEDVRRQERLVSVFLDFNVVHEEIYRRAWTSAGMLSLRHLIKSLRRGDLPDEFGRHLGFVVGDLDDLAVGAYGKIRFGRDYPIDHIKLAATVDPAPNPESRVTLGTDRDQLGQRRVKLDWRLSPIDKHSVRRTVELIAMEFGRLGLGRMHVEVDDSDTTWPQDLVGAWHHVGTTRMSADPRHGVVDDTCRLHEVSNLFVGGSSVFPTAGSGTPTLLIVALALRLADHVKRILR